MSYSWPILSTVTFLPLLGALLILLLRGSDESAFRNARYIALWTTLLTFALRTDHAAGDNGSTVEVIELDCAAPRYRRTSAATTRRNGEMTGSNQPGAYETYPEGSVMAQIAGPLCAGVSGG